MAAARVCLLVSGRPEPASFARSVCGLVGGGQGQGSGPWRAHCSLERGRLVLSDRPFAGASARLPLQTEVWIWAWPSSYSPGPDGAVDPKDKHPQGFSQHLVPPGGHVELEEELLDGGLRELREECGLRLPPGQFSWIPLGLWESAYPPRLSWGFPKYHHIVLYILVTSQESQQQLQIAAKKRPLSQVRDYNMSLQARIQANPQEVSALLWLGPDVAAAVAHTEDGAQTPAPLPRDLPPSVQALQVEDDGRARPLVLPTSTLLRTTPTTADDRERVSTGTKSALRLWLQHLGR